MVSSSLLARNTSAPLATNRSAYSAGPGSSPENRQGANRTNLARFVVRDVLPVAVLHKCRAGQVTHGGSQALLAFPKRLSGFLALVTANEVAILLEVPVPSLDSTRWRLARLLTGPPPFRRKQISCWLMLFLILQPC